jgi:PAT family beta-lactamase induction signal transducer AmpG
MRSAIYNFLSSFQVYWHKRILILFLLGFSGGLPYLLVFSTLSFWLRKAGIDLTTIGFLSWISIVYGLKWLWAPLIDQVPLPWLSRKLGRRKSWLFLSQTLLILSTMSLAGSNPSDNLIALVIGAFLVGICSATQDIVIDAYRIESAPETMQAALAAMYNIGYRLAMITSGAGSLLLVANFQNQGEYSLEAWQATYFIMACLMVIGPITTVLAKEPEVDLKAIEQTFTPNKSNLNPKLPAWFTNSIHWLHHSFVDPFKDFFQRFGRDAWIILCLVSCYRISDMVMGVMANVFYVDLGFLEQEIAAISKVYGVFMTIFGALLGGVILARIGTLKTLFIGAVLGASTNLLFILQFYAGHNLSLLTLIISADNLSAGIATSAFIAYLSSLTSIGYSATQYAIFSSLVVILPKFLAGFSGWFVKTFNYPIFFTTTALLGVPVLGLIIWLIKTNSSSLTDSDKISKFQ